MDDVHGTGASPQDCHVFCDQAGVAPRLAAPEGQPRHHAGTRPPAWSEPALGRIFDADGHVSQAISALEASVAVLASGRRPRSMRRRLSGSGRTAHSRR